MKNLNTSDGKSGARMENSEGEVRDSVLLLLRKILVHKEKEEDFKRTLEALFPVMERRLRGTRPRLKFRMHLFMQWHSRPYRGRTMQPTLLIDCDSTKVWFLYGFVVEPTLSEEDHHIVINWTVETRGKHFFGDRSQDYANSTTYTPFSEAINSLELSRDCENIKLECGVEGYTSYRYEESFKKPDAIDTAQTLEEAIFSHVDEERGEAMQIYRTPVPTHCGMCECEFKHETWLVDGTLKSSFEGMDMCVGCAYDFGRGIGWGKGQIYKKQSDGRWLCVGGFRPEVGDSHL